MSGLGARPSVAFLEATVCAAVLASASVPPLILFWAAARAAASAATWTSVAVSVRRLTSTAIPLMAMIATKRSAASTMAMPRSPSDCAAISSPFATRRVASVRSYAFVVEIGHSVHGEALLAIAVLAQVARQDREDVGHAARHRHLHLGRRRVRAVGRGQAVLGRDLVDVDLERPACDGSDLGLDGRPYRVVVGDRVACAAIGPCRREPRPVPGRMRDHVHHHERVPEGDERERDAEEQEDADRGLDQRLAPLAPCFAHGVFVRQPDSQPETQLGGMRPPRAEQALCPPNAGELARPSVATLHRCGSDAFWRDAGAAPRSSQPGAAPFVLLACAVHYSAAGE